VGVRRSFAGGVLELVEAGRKVGEVAADLGISEQTI
jgi:predicted transcriptional regulator